MITMLCPHCGKEYLLGKTGVMSGCDSCLKITRNKDGMIIWDIPSDDKLLERYGKNPMEANS